jgi:hypothetical protein
MSLRSQLCCLLLIVLHAYARAQGCSDAGVCTAGPIGQLHLWQDSTADVVDYRHMARVSYSYALGEQGTTIMQVMPEVSIGIGPKLAVQVKIPYVWATGNLGENSGIGDLITTASYAFVKERDRNITGTLGLRLPTGKTAPTRIVQATYGPTSRPLPMPYQTGLGTLDLLMGMQYRRGPWSVALAYQHVLHQDNQNIFLHTSWMNSQEALGYFESFSLERADDAVFRLQYAYGCGKLSLQPGLLAIYHMRNDTRLENVIGMDPMLTRMEVHGSQGLTLNITTDLRYKLAEQWAIEATFGTPLITREVRPDGLTRSLVTGVGLRYRF